MRAKEITQFILDKSIKGFLAEDEGEALFDLALEVAHIGPCLEVGSYCGKSSIYLGEACKQTENSLYAIDHHRGSEEHQPGEEYHDEELYDKSLERMNSFPVFQNSIALAGLSDWVIPIVSSSDIVNRHWGTTLGLVFIDGGHSPESALKDCLNWSEKLGAGGVLAVHDIFASREDGGQGPYDALNAVLSRGGFELQDQVNSLGIARKC